MSGTCVRAAGAGAGWQRAPVLTPHNSPLCRHPAPHAWQRQHGCSSWMPSRTAAASHMPCTEGPAQTAQLMPSCEIIQTAWLQQLTAKRIAAARHMPYTGGPAQKQRMLPNCVVAACFSRVAACRPARAPLRRRNAPLPPRELPAQPLPCLPRRAQAPGAARRRWRAPARAGGSRS